MAGIYTQERDLPLQGQAFFRKTGPDGTVLTYERLAPAVYGHQATTSFRSGLGEEASAASGITDRDSYLRYLDQHKLNLNTFDNGHPFSTLKHEAFARFPNDTYLIPRWNEKLESPFVSTQMWRSILRKDYPVVPAWTSQNVDGNIAIAKTYPTAPQASLSQAISELKREGLPSPVGMQISTLQGDIRRAIGGEYLNAVFGWGPLIADLKKLLEAVVHSSKIVQQLERDSGKVVRRKFSFPRELKIVSDDYYNTAEVAALGGSSSPLYARTGLLTVTETRSTQIWFSGAYTYHIDPGKNLVGQAIRFEQLANKLLGTRMTPDVLWNLAPWSWLADWFANIGSNITVASAFQQDGLVLKYGYLMRKVIAERTYSMTTNLPVQGKVPSSSNLILRTTSKERVRSTPFGFGLSPLDFSGRQWAIMGSLGLTKAPRSLR